MDRRFYLDLAASGLRMPIGTHLVLHEHDDPEGIVLDGRRLGAVLRETALRYGSPLAVPLIVPPRSIPALPCTVRSSLLTSVAALTACVNVPPAWMLKS